MQWDEFRGDCFGSFCCNHPHLLLLLLRMSACTLPRLCKHKLPLDPHSELANNTPSNNCVARQSLPSINAVHKHKCRRSSEIAA
jgi:hypothetical protein